MMSARILAFLIIGVVLSASAQVELKLAMMKPQVQMSILQLDAAGIRPLVLQLARVPELYIGVALYLLSMIVWLYVLSRVDMSVAYPFVGLGIVLTTIAGSVLLSEPVTALRLGGCFLIAIGIVLVARS